ncbi:unnamed protein product [Owenia fusiformis]|uniref:Uncharacterized protein n=1 Tax=Owenia fusiformis TaxID=6347 RepID=A0A8S4NE69_OWEFU|nr:unnamed protein product [Owenia fusiformis]
MMALHDGKLGLVMSNVTDRLNHTLRINTIMADHNKQYLKLIEKHRRMRTRKIEWESSKAAKSYAKICSTRKVLDDHCLIAQGEEDIAPLLGPTGLGRYGGASIERLKPDILQKIKDNQPRLRRHRRAMRHLAQGQQDGRIQNLSTLEATKKVGNIIDRPYKTTFEQQLADSNIGKVQKANFTPSRGNTLILPPLEISRTFKQIRKKLGSRSLQGVAQPQKPIVLTPIKNEQE